jgi:TolB-like protein/DNA-binding winged helix-turn-helix (wHTH) protein/tetratricopeptide (TPR) repeat protein
VRGGSSVRGVAFRNRVKQFLRAGVILCQRISSLHDAGTADRVRFGPFQLDVRSGEVFKGSTRLRVPDQSIEILKALVEKPGQLITREELRHRLWPDNTFVDFEHGLNAAVRRLRDALGDSADAPAFIETLPRRGYRFVGQIEADLNSVTSPTSDQRVLESRRRKAPRLLAVIALVVVIAAAVLWRTAPREPVVGTIRAVAILPLKNVSKDPAQDYFVEGMHEALITALAHAGCLGVIARSSTLRYANTDKSVATIARELNVQAIVEGSVLRVGEQVRITVRLVEPTSGRTLWTDSFDRSLRDVLALHSEVAQAIAGGIVTASDCGRTSTPVARRVDPEAYESYLKGRYHLNQRTEHDLLQAVEDFRRAIARDPSYALAYAGLADARNLLPLYGSTAPREVIPDGKSAALSAIHVDETVADGHASLAWASLAYDWDWTTADREFARAIAIDPANPITRMWHGLALVWRGRFDQGIAELDRARTLDPVSPLLLQNVAAVFYFARDYDRAIRETDTLLELDSSWAEGYVWQGLAKLQKGKPDDAVRSLERAVVLTDRSTAIARLAYGYGLAEQRDAALSTLARLKGKSRQGYVSAVNFATAYVSLGDKETALNWLERGLEERATEMLFLKTDPRFDPLRSDARFQRLLERMNFQN